MGAFDQIQTNKLCQVLSKKKFPPSFISWVQTFLSGRNISLLFKGQLSQPYHVTGPPQGGPVSPLLFLLSLSLLTPPALRDGFLEISYVDDTCISFVSYCWSSYMCGLVSQVITGVRLAYVNKVEMWIERINITHFLNHTVLVPKTSSLLKLTLSREISLNFKTT